MKFYRSLRSFIIFNIVLLGISIISGGSTGLWFIAKIWGIFLVIHYLKINGLPGTKGWLSKDWEAWMEEREKQEWDNEPETIVEEPEAEKILWRDRDLV